MRETAAMLATLGAALLLVGAAVFAGGDRSTFVPVPEAVAENFTREIASRRYALALKFLAPARQRAETSQTLAARFDPLLAAVGKVDHVGAEPSWMQGDYAGARATVEGERGSVSFELRLVREQESGLWRIDHLPDLH